jgi:hypothetical protein
MPEIYSDALPAAKNGAADLPSCAVMVSSCDAYRDLWRPFFTLFWRYWPDCPFPVYLGSNETGYEHPRVTTLKVPEQTWSKNLKGFLEQIEADYVLMLLDDFFLDGAVDTNLLVRHLVALNSFGGTVLRIYPRPGPEERLAGHKEIGSLHPRAPYRVSAQPAFWNRQKLISLLRDDESAWEFESKGTERSQVHANGFYGTYKPLLSYCHVVERGEWFRSAARRYKTEQIGCDFAARPVMGPLKAVKKAVNRFRKDS